MLKNKRVSVVLAAHNGERYIGPQISSILSQLEENDELIVSVDPSEDRTVSVIQGFQDSRIRMLQGPGQGIVKNFEHGLMASSGDFIFLADQDDVWQPDKVQTVLDVLKQDETLLVLHDCRMTMHCMNWSHPISDGTEPEGDSGPISSEIHILAAAWPSGGLFCLRLCPSLTVCPCTISGWA